MTSASRALAPSLEELASRWPVVVFDLDGTLYDESRYLQVAHAAIARRLASEGLAVESQVARQLAQDRRAGRMSGIFDRAIKELRLPPEALAIMLEVLRTVEVPEAIPLHSWAHPCLEYLHGHGRRLFILTNGNPEQQVNKIRLLGLDKGIIGLEPIFADQLARKPDPAGLLEIARRAGCETGGILFIGNHEVDEACALAAGSWFASSSDVARLFLA